MSGVMFFSENLITIEGGSAASALVSGDDSVQSILDRNPDTYWRSVDSDDTTEERIIIEFPTLYDISALFLIGMNFKEFKVRWQTFIVGTWNEFTNVTGVGGAKSGVNETTYAYDTGYYTFDSVNTAAIEIKCLKTQVADAEKFLSQVFVVESRLGQLSGYPNVTVHNDRASKVRTAISGRRIISKSRELLHADLTFDNYPTASEYVADVELIYSLFHRDKPFLVWLCGGAVGSTAFKHTLRGFRLRDVVQMQIENVIDATYNENIYIAQANLEVNLVEHI